MGTENASGEFEVVDVKVADLPRQPERWERDDSALALKGEKINSKRPKTGKVAVVSGLSIKGDGTDTFLLDLLTEYLLGESGCEDSPNISRLIIAGNSLAHASSIPSREELAEREPGKNKYGHDTTIYDPTPSEHLDMFLAQLLPSIPITILPGATDPSSVAIPQQALHPALFPHSRSYANLPIQVGGDPSWFDCVTNPWEGDVDGLRFLGNSGQPINDMYKYVTRGKRLEMMEHLLRWRNNAPTAPDTLCKFHLLWYVMKQC
jgi:DNA polymerase delta subunit 2